MKGQVKHILAVILVGVMAWVTYAELTGSPLIPGRGGTAASVAVPPEPDTKKLAELKDVSSIKVTGVLGGQVKYDMGGRNLFQYGVMRPPPPTPAELETMRKAEEARLKSMEEEARRRAEEQQAKIQAENEQRAKEAQEALQRVQQQPSQPPAAQPARPAPPPMNLKLVGYMGPKSGRIAVFLSGNDIVLGKKGEVVDGKFRVLSIGTESVELGYADPAFKDAKKRLELGS